MDAHKIINSEKQVVLVQQYVNEIQKDSKEQAGIEKENQSTWPLSKSELIFDAKVY